MSEQAKSQHLEVSDVSALSSDGASMKKTYATSSRSTNSATSITLSPVKRANDADTRSIISEWIAPELARRIVIRECALKISP